MTIACSHTAYRWGCQFFMSCLQSLCKFHGSEMCFCMIHMLNTVSIRTVMKIQTKFSWCCFSKQDNNLQICEQFSYDSFHCRQYELANWGETGQSWCKIGDISKKIVSLTCTINGHVSTEFFKLVPSWDAWWINKPYIYSVQQWF
jgi:hypothetical protein